MSALSNIVVEDHLFSFGALGTAALEGRWFFDPIGSAVLDVCRYFGEL